MKTSTVHRIAGPGEAHHHEPKHLAEQMEAWVGRTFMALGAALLAGLLYAVTQTGAGAPTWMQ